MDVSPHNLRSEKKPIHSFNIGIRRIDDFDFLNVQKCGKIVSNFLCIMYEAWDNSDGIVRINFRCLYEKYPNNFYGETRLSEQVKMKRQFHTF